MVEANSKQKLSVDPVMRQRMKAASEQKRKAAMATSRPSDSDDKMSFDQWWMLVNLRSNVKPSLKETVWADFKARGLSSSETQATYDKTIKIFGLDI